MDEINLFLHNFLKGKKKKEGYYTACLQIKWQQLAGEYIAQKSFPKAIKDDILFLDVVSAGWAHNFLMIKEEILNKINTNFNAIIVKEIKFNVRAKIDKLEQAVEVAEKIELPELDADEYQSVRDLADQVTDKSLSGKLARLLIKDKKRKKYLLAQGHPVCLGCGVALSYQENYCAACAKNVREQQENKLFQTLSQLPWISFDQLSQTMPVNYILYKQVKERCQQLFFEQATKKDATRNDVQKYVMLATGVSAFDLTEEIVDETMKKVWRVKHVSAPRFRYDGGR